jgi:hypothetical protein
MDDITHDDVLPGQMIETLLEAMDAKCKVEDAERRRLATAKRSAIKSPVETQALREPRLGYILSAGNG